MDPLSALSLAAAIVQFIDFASKIAHGTRQTYVSGTGAAAADADVELCATELDSLCARLDTSNSSPRTDDEEALHRLASRCRAISAELSTLLRTVKAKNPHSKWQCFVSAVKTHLKKSQREDLVIRLCECRAQLDVQLTRLASLDSKEILEQVVHLQSRNDNSFQNVLNSLQDLRDNVSISSLTPNAEAQLRRMFTLSEDTSKAITAGRILNLFCYEGMHEPYEHIAAVHDGTFAWIVDKRLTSYRETVIRNDLFLDEDHARPGAPQVAGDTSVEDQSHGSNASDVRDAHDTQTSTVEHGFPEWLLSGHGIFHIVGKPNSGKSALMKFLSNHAEVKRMLKEWTSGCNLVTARCFFWGQGQKNRDCVAALYQSILFDILEQFPQLIEEVLPELWNAVSRSPWQVDAKIYLAPYQIKTAIQRLVSRNDDTMASYKFAFFIDGLDEHADGNSEQTLADELQSWTVASSNRVKICVSSRPHPYLLHVFRNDHQLWLDKYNKLDIRRMAEHQIRVSLKSIPECSPALARISSHVRLIPSSIAERADGDFKWAARAAKATVMSLQHVCEGLVQTVAGEWATPSPLVKTSMNSLEDAMRRLTLDNVLRAYHVPLWPDHASGSIGNSVQVEHSQKTLATIESHAASEEQSRHTEMQDLKGLLEVFEHPEADLFAVDDARVSGTCEWILQKPGYQSWIEPSSEGVQMLRLAGAPASGKSTVAGFVVNKLKKDNLHTSYFFFKHSDRAKKDLHACLKSIVFQMAQTDSAVRRRLISLKMQHRLRHGDLDNERSLWRKLFLDAIFQRPFARHYWVIDALDECENVDFVFSTMLGKLDPTLNLSIFVTSRETAALESDFSSLAMQAKLTTLRVSPNDTLADIRLLIQAKGGTCLARDECSQATMNTVLTKSRGSFLWTVLVLKELSNAFSEEEVCRVLDDVPLGMKPLYSRTLDLMQVTDRGKHLAKAILAWTACVVRPLTVQELKDALRLDVKQNFSDLETAITALCGQLVTVDKTGKVQMIHATAREFMLDTELVSDFAVREIDAHTRLAEVCLQYLTSDQMSVPRSTRRGSARSSLSSRAAFSAYACAEFSYHLCKSDPTSSAILPLLDRFLNANVLSWIEAASRGSSLRIITQTSTNLARFVRICRQNGSPFEAELALASRWSEDMVRVSARFADALIASPTAAFSLIPPFCPAKSALHNFAKTNKALSVLGAHDLEWDDRLLCVDFRSQTSCVGQGEDYFAIGLSTGLIVLYNVFTGQEYRTLEHQEAVTAIRFSPGTNLLASGGLRSIRIWDVKSGDMLHNLTCPQRCIGLEFHENKLIAPCDKNFLASWDLCRGALRLPDKVWDTGSDYNDTRARRPPSALSISLGHKLMAVAYLGRPIVLWDLEEECYYGVCGKRLASGERSGHLVTALLLNPNPAMPLLAASYLDGELVLLNPFDDITIKAVRANCPKLAASPDGRLLAGAAGAGAIDIYGFDSLHLIYRVRSSTLYVRQLAFSSNSLSFIDIRGTICNVWSPAALRHVAAQDDRDIGEDPAQTFVGGVASAPSTRLTAIALSPAGDYALCGESNGNVLLFDLRDGHRVKTLFQHRTTPRHLAWLSATNTCISVDASNAVKAFRLQKWPSFAPEIDIELFQNRVESDTTVTQLLVSQTVTKFILSTRASDHLWTLDGNEVCQLRCDAARSIRKWAQHPSSAAHVLCVEPTGIRIHTWHDFSLTTKLALVADPTKQLKSVQIVTLARSQSVLIELSELNGAADTRDLFLIESEMIPITSNDKEAEYSLGSLGRTGKETLAGDHGPSPEQSLTKLLSGRCSHVLGSMGGGKLVFLDRQSWICSVDLTQQSCDHLHYLRHVFIPYDWLSGSRDIVSALSRRDVIFARNERIAIVRGGFDFLEEVPMPANTYKSEDALLSRCGVTSCC